MLYFLQWFVFPVGVAVIVAILLANPIGFYRTQRITGGLAIVFAAWFLAHTMYKHTTDVAERPAGQSGVTAPTSEQPGTTAQDQGQTETPVVNQTVTGDGGVAVVGDGNTIETDVESVSEEDDKQP